VFSYSLALQTDWRPDDVDAQLQKVLVARRADRAGDDGTALTGRALPVTSASIQATLDDALGGHVDVEVRLELDPKSDGYEQARRDLAIAAAVVATSTARTACLAFEYERVLMRLDGGRLMLHDWYPEWHDPAVIAALPVPFDRSSDAGEI